MPHVAAPSASEVPSLPTDASAARRDGSAAAERTGRASEQDVDNVGKRASGRVVITADDAMFAPLL
jgi:hypothetical protein